MMIVKMFKTMNKPAIVEELGISRINISEILSEFQKTGCVLNRPNYGRFTKAAPQDNTETDQFSERKPIDK